MTAVIEELQGPWGTHSHPVPSPPFHVFGEHQRTCSFLLPKRLKTCNKKCFVRFSRDKTKSAKGTSYKELGVSFAVHVALDVKYTLLLYSAHSPLVFLQELTQVLYVRWLNSR